MPFSFSIDQLKEAIGPHQAEGTTAVAQIKGIAALNSAQTGDLSFLANPKYRSQVAHTRASVVLVPNDYVGTPPVGQLFIRVANPSFALANICRKIEGTLRPKPQPGIHPSACVDPTARIAPTAHIGPYVSVGAHCTIADHVVIESHCHISQHVSIGEGSYLFPHACILSHSQLGREVVVFSMAVIGSDGFGYSTVEGAHIKEPQIGNVIIEDQVDIGANTTIDRARFGSTVIGRGTKIDNQVQIAHNVRIGKYCLIVSQAGIAGSAVLEDYVTLGGQVGIAGHITLKTGSIVGAQSGVNGNLPERSYVTGTPPHPVALTLRIESLKKRLPELFERLSHLEQLVQTTSIAN